MDCTGKTDSSFKHVGTWTYLLPRSGQPLPRITKVSPNANPGYVIALIISPEVKVYSFRSTYVTDEDFTLPWNRFTNLQKSRSRKGGWNAEKNRDMNDWSLHAD
jgi:hypothetical protein